jgi:hypothetical protein
MQNRTAKFVSAIFASVLAGTSLTTISHGAVPAADDCLSGPKGQAPKGSHWYYRVDRASKRHCWYIGEERERLSRATPQNSAPIKDSASPQKETVAQRPIADAHAELPLPQTRVEQQTAVPAWQTSPVTTANAASVENSQPSNAPDANTRLSVIASRWPESSGAISSAAPAPIGHSGEVVQSNSEAEPLPAVAAVTPAATNPSSEKQSGSPQMLFIVMMGALVLAGIMGSAIFRFGGRSQAGRRQTRGDRRAIWDSVDGNRPWPPAHPRANISMRRDDISGELPQADDTNDRIAAMLARLSKSAAT